MLLEVNIKNFALVKDLVIKFNNGLNVLMGETGAGKSNIIDALGVLMGERATKDKINNNSDSAYISAAFDVDNIIEIKNILSRNGIFLDDEPLIISREINRKSSSISKINGEIVPISLLKEVSKYIIDIYGQFDNVLILSKLEQRKFIDRLGNESFKKLVHEYEEKFTEYMNKKSEIENMVKSPEDIARMVDILKFQIEEIEDSKVLELNEKEIEARLVVLENMQMLIESTEEINQILDGENDRSILSDLGKAVTLSNRISTIDKNFIELESRLNQTYIDLKDIKFEVSNYLSDMSYDQEELQILDRHRSNIYSMKRKYGKEIEDVISFYKNAQSDLFDIQNYENKLKLLNSEIEIQKKSLYNLALNISSERKVIIKKLEENLKEEFKELEMNDAIFKVDIHEQEINQSGIDDITFMVSFNKNQPLKELSTVASGGEISRFMLAVKSIEANIDMIPTLIFDEIDTGISGNAGKVVARKLKKLSEIHQLISISHLPQIISRADFQFLVYKTDSETGIESHIRLLSDEERVIQLAMVIEGNDYSENTLITAKKMIQDGR